MENWKPATGSNVTMKIRNALPSFWEAKKARHGAVNIGTSPLKTTHTSLSHVTGQLSATPGTVSQINALAAQPGPRRPTKSGSSIQGDEGGIPNGSGARGVCGGGGGGDGGGGEGDGGGEFTSSDRKQDVSESHAPHDVIASPPGLEMIAFVTQNPAPSSGTLNDSGEERSITRSVMNPDGKRLPLRLKPTMVPSAPTLTLQASANVSPP
mmetsp:Transcript_5968/g.21849  ORF Transcript_5968/g.21849 Transcript_5968/m.21849 type:complete len:210 (+) Transcript_5968:683-1312(+)